MNEGDGIELGAFRAVLARLIDEAKRADLRNFSTLEGDARWLHIVARASLPIAKRITSEARTALGKLLDQCGTPASDEEKIPSVFPDFDQPTQPQAVISEETPRPRALAIEDMAFMVQSELRQRAERLGRLSDNSDPLSIIGECDGALRRVRRGLQAVDRVIETGDMRSAHACTGSELEESLAVRRAYARARRYFVERSTPTATELLEALRGASARLDSLCQGEVSTLVRVRDRLQLSDLHRRVHAWLKAGGVDALGGLRLWQDTAAVFHMIQHVNRRQELIEHDAQVVREVLRALELAGGGRHATGMSGVSGVRLGLALESRLQRLQGLDEELDQYLTVTDGYTPALRAVLERLNQRFGGSASRAQEGVA